ncbi:Pseudouridine synthase [Glarea lozoyensis ATCC 20868]|uniref:tRNA pseudouridine synthase 1 n=1 Tax=Glarea lozoyensis (strain ATCC 20868 / MF5171) TaxID=1116229 RepID=S3CIA5_GLAL2|nr:Pseudouridine synthase [Glarea lozoyensis ATCC 20868]EPE24999.1 Pseudouridine synthase [Glarea lozoyensis ATCC 20868]
MADDSVPAAPAKAGGESSSRGEGAHEAEEGVAGAGKAVEGEAMREEGVEEEVLGPMTSAAVIRKLIWVGGNTSVDRRKRRDEKTGNGETDDVAKYHSTQFSKEEIEAEGRKPKRKVAVLIGYAGSGYKGMQINGTEKTIEGDLFKAFVAAGAISKANADDPKKSTLVRCARTDKGVHAAGNVISLKLIVEEDDIVQKINAALPPQIRVWGYERTNGSFSCYQSCDSRWYEYLIPTYSFLPPHPRSFLGRKLVDSAEKKGVLDEYKSRQEDVANFWDSAEEKYIKPILDELDPEMRDAVMESIHASEIMLDLDLPKPKKEKPAKAKPTNVSMDPATQAENEASLLNVHGDRKAHLERAIAQDQMKRKAEEDSVSRDQPPPKIQRISPDHTSVDTPEQKNGLAETNALATESPSVEVVASEDSNLKAVDTTSLVENAKEEVEAESTAISANEEADSTVADTTAPLEGAKQELEAESTAITTKQDEPRRELTPLEVAIKRVKAAYITAKKAYRISEYRRQRVEEALNTYVGTCNFHNYTIQKSFSDPSAKRVIRSFKVGKDPVYINDTEWLSLKVHGQSFMMHQIRKMVAMASMVVRCGSTAEVIRDSYGRAPISIPKAPSLGLLLERPVFNSYNTQAVSKFNREKIDFDKYQKEMDEFKQREIYDRIFREEERDNQFHTFFHHIDNFKTDYFLWVTAEGVAGARQSVARSENVLPEDVYESDEEQPDAKGEEG